jgi:hypothetical protein
VDHFGALTRGLNGRVHTECRIASRFVPVKWGPSAPKRLFQKFRFDEEGGQNHVPKCKQSHSNRVPWRSA